MAYVHAMRRSPLLLASVLLLACGGATRPAEEPRAEASVAVEPEAPRPLEREGTIERAELDAVLAGGFGLFLQRVTTEPHLDAGRFVGFRLTELRTEIFEGVDLRPGDTLLSVNGLPIERPEEALMAWNALRVASELTLEVLREGERRQLRFAIAD